jgi:hypothetical protein
MLDTVLDVSSSRRSSDAREQRRMVVCRPEPTVDGDEVRELRRAGWFSPYYASHLTEREQATHIKGGKLRFRRSRASQIGSMSHVPGTTLLLC